MCEKVEMKFIARYHCDFKEKFGIPRQSGIVMDLPGKIVFEPEFRNVDAFRGIEEFSHIWILWQFSKSVGVEWTPTVRPPKLGGNKRVGVFATRSPFRPNNIGLSCVELERLEVSDEYGPVLHVKSADLLDNTPIFDIKPYIAYADSYPQANQSFSKPGDSEKLDVTFSPDCSILLDEENKEIIVSLLEQDPRPGYQNDPDRIYYMKYGNLDIGFKVNGKMLIVVEIDKI